MTHILIKNIKKVTKIDINQENNDIFDGITVDVCVSVHYYMCINNYVERKETI